MEVDRSDFQGSLMVHADVSLGRTSYRFSNVVSLVHHWIGATALMIVSRQVSYRYASPWTFSLSIK